MTTPLPIGVLLPTLNARALLPAHLAQLKQWADLVEEIVVVDSFSQDGTFEYVKSELNHPKLRLFQQPRGLYQAWNFGVNQLSAKYTYVSTAGDIITSEGLVHLVQTAEKHTSDVVISRPEFIGAHGQPADEKPWPIHQLLQACPLSAPIRLPHWQAFLLTTLDSPQGLFGSSASNLYLTGTLRRFPFPTDCGHAGDTGWSIRHAFETSWSITPRVFSQFVLHPNEVTSMDATKHRKLGAHLHRMADEVGREALGKITNQAALQKLLPLYSSLLLARHKVFETQQAYYEAKRNVWPWFVNPDAWHARSKRIRERSCMLKLAAQLRLEFGSANQLPPEPEPALRSMAGYISQRLCGLCA